MNRIDDAWVQAVRKQFPALQRVDASGRPVAFLDGPAGTQVPTSVPAAMSTYLLECNANHGGLFATSQESDDWLDQAHLAFADLAGGDDPGEIVFGQNMTSLTFAFSRAFARTWSEGDEIVVTRLDHDANVTPWVLAARDAGATVRWIDFDPADGRLNLEQLAATLNERTRLVAVGVASNASGGINPVRKIAELAHNVGALVYLDAVHYGPHGLMDAKAWDADLIAFSAYKFFGPHLGIVWGRRDLLESLEAYKVRPAANDLPGKWMTGTQSHESIVGGMAAVDYLADLGRGLEGSPQLSRREALQSAMASIVAYEAELSLRFLAGAASIPGLRIHGIVDPADVADRVPTFSLSSDRVGTEELARRLVAAGLFVWHGNYYALEFSEQLGREPEGMIRVGLVHYNTLAEVDRIVEQLAILATRSEVNA